MGSLYQRGEIFWTKLYVGGGKYLRESTDTTDRREAEKVLAKREGAIESGAAPIARPDKVKYADLRADLITHYEVTGEREAKEYGKRLLHLDPFFAHHRAVAIDGAAITRYSKARLGEGAAAGTINRELGVLGKMLALAVRNRKLAAKPHVQKLEESAPRAGFVDRDMFERIAKHLAPDLQLVVRIAFTYGWRVGSEVLTLQWDQVNIAEKTLRLNPGATKNGEGRVVILTDELAVLFAEQRARVKAALGKVTACVFPVLPGPQARQKLIGTQRQGFARAWKSAVAAAGVPDLLAHDLRRSAVRELLAAGVAQTVAMKVTGHKTAAVFARYAIVDEATLTDATNKIQARSIAGGR
jgi:integrase